MTTQKRCSPKQPSTRLTEPPTKLDGLSPLAFLAAIINSDYVEIDGLRHRPTLKERRQAAARLVAALDGRSTHEDDSYPPQEEGSKP